MTTPNRTPRCIKRNLQYEDTTDYLTDEKLIFKELPQNLHFFYFIHSSLHPKASNNLSPCKFRPTTPLMGLCQNDKYT